MTLHATAALGGGQDLSAPQATATSPPAQLEGGKTNQAAPAKKAKGIPLNGTLAAVDKTARTITLEGKERGRTFVITAQTRITRNGEPATLEDLKPGEKVGGYARLNAEGRYELTTLNQGVKPGPTSKGKASSSPKPSK